MKMKKILFVCLGNICRSSTADGVMLHLIKEAGLEKEFVIDSAGILSYHQGELVGCVLTRLVAVINWYIVRVLSVRKIFIILI